MTYDLDHKYKWDALMHYATVFIEVPVFNRNLSEVKDVQIP
jgi:hypothetical protein